MRRRRLLALAVPVLVAIAAQAASPAAAAPRSSARLARFDSCAELTSYARSAVRRTRGSVGVPTRVGSVASQPLGRLPTTGDQQFADGVTPVASAPAAAPQEAGGESTTNVQEAGIDEPDLVKSDGRRLFALVNGALHAIEVNHDTPVLAGSLTLAGSPAELLVRGDRVLVIGSAATATPQPGPPGVVSDTAVPEDAGGQQVQLTEVDVSDPARMRVARTLSVPGAYVSARLTGGTARVVLSSPPELPVPASAVAARAAVVPRSTLRSRLSGRTFRRALVRCRAVRHPVRFSGLDLLTVLTIDLDQGLFDVDRDAIVAGAQTVYASGSSLYVASQRWVPGVAGNLEEAAGLTTEIHRFDASPPGATAYTASGTVTGSVLNQFSLSEHDGALRVATTDTPPWVAGAPQATESESAVTVLRERDGRLETAGRVGGLGRGERIYAVRFVGERGYVVTFRQVDPLYVVDLADPAAPRVAGELKIPGYSAYLHPVGDDLLLGVGQDANEQGRVTGLQVSLFDVSNPSRPERLDAHALGGNSEVEHDHHAFLWWAPEQLAVLPTQQYTVGSEGTGAVGLRVTRATGIGQRGRVEHPGPSPLPVRRSLVAGERLVTVSDGGVATSRLATLAPLGFLAFPQAP